MLPQQLRYSNHTGDIERLPCIAFFTNSMTPYSFPNVGDPACAHHKTYNIQGSVRFLNIQTCSHSGDLHTHLFHLPNALWSLAYGLNTLEFLQFVRDFRLRHINKSQFITDSSFLLTNITSLLLNPLPFGRWTKLVDQLMVCTILTLSIWLPNNHRLLLNS